MRLMLSALAALLLLCSPAQALQRNVAGQTISVHLYTAAGGDVTSGTTTCYVVADAGTESAGAAATHEGHGAWSYAITQGETDGAHIAVTCENTTAVTQTVQTYTTEGAALAVWQHVLPHTADYPTSSAGHILWHLNALEATISSSTDESTFVVDSGPAVQDAYNGMVFSLINTATGYHEARLIKSWSAGRQIVTDRPLSFVPGVGTHAHISGVSYVPPFLPTADEIGDDLDHRHGHGPWVK